MSREPGAGGLEGSPGEGGGALGDPVSPEAEKREQKGQGQRHPGLEPGRDRSAEEFPDKLHFLIF